MPTMRLLFQLFVLSLGFLTATVLVVTHDVSGTGASVMTRLAGLTLPAGSSAAFSAVLGSPGLVAGVVIGWLLHWIYSLPWGAIPRAIGEWLLGWRQSAVLTLVALGCVTVLLVM